MKQYKYLIFDIDDTLLDFYSAFSSAQEKVAAFLGIECSDEFKKTDERCGWRAWKESGLENTDTKDVQTNYHHYYYEYIRLHYKYLTEELGLAADTGGIVQTQKKRVSDFLPYTNKVYISEKWE